MSASCLRSLIEGNDIALSLWDAVTSKQLKLEHILSLKSTNDKPIFKSFSNAYASIMEDIRRGEVELYQFKELSQEQEFGVEEVQSLFKTVEDTLSTEFAMLGKAFEAGLEEILTDSTSEDKCIVITESC